MRPTLIEACRGVNLCSAVIYNREEAAQTGMPFAKFPAWAKAVAKLSPLRAAYYRFCLLTGARGGEAARLEWKDVDCRARTITFRQAKAGADIVLPMSAAIARELKRARDAEGVAKDSRYIFSGVRGVTWKDKLPAKGHALRHSWRTVAADCGVDELQARLLLGHSLVGISQSYVTCAALQGGPGLRAAQRQVSNRIVGLLGEA